MRVKFWGTRGSIATPGQDTVKYGGNTSCVEASDGNHLVVFDAGTGLRMLGVDLLKRTPPGKSLQGHLFISHFHFDHIQGFPFFQPVYVPGNSFTIYGCEGTGKKLENIFIGQMSPEFFPVTLNEMPADIKFVQLTTRPIPLDGWVVTPGYINHPGLALGYRLETPRSRMVYMTDNEPFRYLLRQQAGLSPIYDDLDRGVVELEREDKVLVDFMKGADLLIHDAQYTIEEYRKKTGWGHSFYEYTLEMAIQAGVKHLVLFHHDPLRSDRELDVILDRLRGVVARRNSRLLVEAAWEGMEIHLP